MEQLIKKLEQITPDQLQKLELPPKPEGYLRTVGKWLNVLIDLPTSSKLNRASASILNDHLIVYLDPNGSLSAHTRGNLQRIRLTKLVLQRFGVKPGQKLWYRIARFKDGREVAVIQKL